MKKLLSLFLCAAMAASLVAGCSSDQTTESSSGTADNSQQEAASSEGPEEEADELLSDAIDLVVKSGQASVSMLQRRFRIGYNRAARIMDMMEARGIVSAQDGSRPRQVLLSEEELKQMEEDTEGI